MLRQMQAEKNRKVKKKECVVLDRFHCKKILKLHEKELGCSMKYHVSPFARIGMSRTNNKYLLHRSPNYGRVS